MEDWLAEQMHGEGAISLVGKVVLRPTSNNNQIIAGAFIPKIVEEDEMWECQIILVPLRKYKGLSKYLRGHRIDQILTGGFEKRSFWKKLYWKKKD